MPDNDFESIRGAFHQAQDREKLAAHIERVGGDQLADRYADALIAIVGQSEPCNGELHTYHDRHVCPFCRVYMDWAGDEADPRPVADHHPGCPWMVAARALRIA